ncbi:unnamed protein product [Spirodela intermedia]|uniref:Tf2-1-like SH3-like domain-containing protein n=2 Tax=Spirodela intermedia TaxID=51605 RepID=A0A7I8L231_SPIIN|nr:unnamed protein product [Spirodela intermedia]CAA6667247.1 unnamed protein product [Spirodela intermedia]CAA7404071.1 unnamed protein product [Spirodela intermedia]
MTPFRAAYGRDPWKLIKYGTSPSPLDAIDHQLLSEQNAILKILKFNLHKAQVGDMVFLKIKPYQMKSLAKKEIKKINPHYFDPYPIMERIGPVAYKLQLPNHSVIHPVFHISQLKKTLRTHSIKQEWILILDGIKAHRSTPQDTKILVSWKHLPKFESLWMTVSTFLRQFPTSHLVDKVKLMGGSNVIKPTIIYTR